MKRILLTLICSFAAASAQLPWPVDVEVSSKWFLTDDASLFGSARTHLPLDFEMLGVTPYLIPEVGYHYESLEPYASLELNADAEYLTLAIWATYRSDLASERDALSLSVASRFCILSERCSE